MNFFDLFLATIITQTFDEHPINQNIIFVIKGSGSYLFHLDFPFTHLIVIAEVIINFTCSLISIYINHLMVIICILIFCVDSEMLCIKSIRLIKIDISSIHACIHIYFLIGFITYLPLHLFQCQYLYFLTYY